MSSQIEITVGGAPLDQEAMANLMSMEVSQHAHLPGMFQLEFYDANFELMDGSALDLGKEVVIKAEDASGNKAELIKGEITAHEPRFSEGRISYFIVRGYDKLHRLYREKKSKAFLNKKDSDIAQEIAGNCGLSAQVDATTVQYEHVFQHNQSDMGFLMQRAWRIGYECYAAEGKLFFKKPSMSGSGPELTWGVDLISFAPRMTLAEQVDEVHVQGWDPKTKKVIDGKASSGALDAQVKDTPGKKKASQFGTGKYVIVDQPAISVDEAKKMAEARMNEFSGSFVIADGTAYQRPDVKAGQIVEIKEVGERFSGKYLVTEVAHRYGSDGLRCHFTARGTRTGLMAEQLSQTAPIDRWPGVVIAVVTNNQDPDKMGRVKVKYPWLDESQESGWIRVVGAGAGKERGLYMIPDVNDEVLVAFEFGDFNYPVVLGGLWNGKDKLPPKGDDAADADRHKVRSWTSNNGHYIAMYDDQEDKIEINTAGGHNILISDKDKKIVVKTTGGMEFSFDDQGKSATVKGTGTMNIETQQGMTIKGMQITIEASSKLELKGATVDITGSGAVNVKGATINLG